MPSESQIQKRLLQKLNEVGWFYNTNDRFRAGVPDILGCYKGVLIAIEVKIDYRQTTPLQKYELNNINKAGGVACVVRFNNARKTYSVTNYTENLDTKDMKEIIKWILKLSPLNTNSNAMKE